MSQLDILRDDLGLRAANTTRNNMLGQASRFLAFTGEKPQYSRQDIQRYLDHLTAKGLTTGSLKMAQASIKRLLEAIDQPWPFNAKLHLRGEPDGKGVVLPTEDVRKLIMGARREPAHVRALVALSTVFGFRAAELESLMAVGHDGPTLVLQTVKARVVRRHLVPTQLQGVLGFPPSPIPYHEIQELFQYLMETYVRSPRGREGFHAIRRSIVTELLQHVSEYSVYWWMGWTMSKTAFHYFNPPDPRVIEREIYQHHPFVRFWLQPAEDTLPGFEKMA